MSPLFSVLYVIGITAESMTAALSAGRQKLDSRTLPAILRHLDSTIVEEPLFQQQW